MNGARLEVYRSALSRPSQRWRWRLVATNGRKLCNGGEGYARRDACIDMARAILCGAYGDLTATPVDK